MEPKGGNMFDIEPKNTERSLFDLERYIQKKKQNMLEAIKYEEYCIESMKSQLRKLYLNNEYGKRYIEEAKMGIQKNQQLILDLKDKFKKIPVLKTIEQIFTEIISEGLISNREILKLNDECLADIIKQNVEMVITDIEHVEVNEELIIKGTNSDIKRIEIYEKYKNIKLPVDGYLLYSLIGHSGEYLICSYNNRKEIEKEILSCRGLNNMFTTQMTVLFNGNIERYYITNKKGTILTKEQIVRMSLKTVSKLNIVWEN